MSIHESSTVPYLHSVSIHAACLIDLIPANQPKRFFNLMRKPDNGRSRTRSQQTYSRNASRISIDDGKMERLARPGRIGSTTMSDAMMCCRNGGRARRLYTSSVAKPPVHSRGTRRSTGNLCSRKTDHPSVLKGDLL